MTDLGPERPVRLDQRQNPERIAVLVNGEPFTAYRYGDPDVTKPVLFPIRAPSGDPVTRGYPIDPRSEDRRDHPHQVGSWFTYGNVDGIDFWNNSPELPPSRADEVGTIRHREVTTADDTGLGADLGVRCGWLGPDEKELLEERTRFAFRASRGRRVIDRTTTLSATDDAVTFHDDKEGLFGLRVARSLEHPVEEEVVFVDVAGKETVVTATGDHEVTGTYRSSTGTMDEETWGTRAPWMALTGMLGENEVTVAILDHPDNPGYPTHWMARPYGLFAANPLGRSAFDETASPMAYTIEPGEPATFRYRIVIRNGGADPDVLDEEHERFANGGD